MKIRSGFVSNSSSSSFCVVGQQIDNPDTQIELGKQVIVIVEGGGTSGEAEDWSMFLDEECYNMLKDNEWFKRAEGYGNVKFIVCNKDAHTEYDDELHDDVLVCTEDVEGHVYIFNRDYSSPENKEELINFLKDMR